MMPCYKRAWGTFCPNALPPPGGQGFFDMLSRLHPDALRDFRSDRRVMSGQVCLIRAT